MIKKIEKTFKCIHCGEVFKNFYKDRDLDSTCKYCAENEIFNEHKDKRG